MMPVRGYFLLLACLCWTCGSQAAAVESVSLVEFWDIIANESTSVVLGVHLPADHSASATSPFLRVAAAYEAFSESNPQEDRVLFRIAKQAPSFVDRPSVLVFTKTEPDLSCLVKPDIRSFPKDLHEYVSFVGVG